MKIPRPEHFAESDGFQTFLGVCLLAAIGLVLIVSISDQNKAAAAKSNAVGDVQSDSVAVTGPAAQQQPDPTMLNQYYWPGQNITSESEESLTGWLGNTAPGFDAWTAPVTVQSSAGGKRSILSSSAGLGAAATSINL
jgi:hypothetical protein